MAFLFLKKSRKGGKKTWYIIDKSLPPGKQWIPLGVDKVEVDRGRATQILRRYQQDTSYLRLDLPSAARPITFRELAVEYLEWRRGRVREITRDGERRQFIVLEKTFGPLQLEDIAPEAIKDHLLARGLKPNSLRLAIQALRNLYNYAIQEKYLVGDAGEPATNPMDRLPRPRIEKAVPKAIDLDTAKKIIQAMKGRRRLYFSLMVLTGMRPGEAARLQVRHGLPDGILLEATKNHSERIQPWTPEIKKIWDELAAGKGPDDFLFPGRKGGHQLSFKKALKGAVERAGVYHVTPHRFRHTFASEVLRKTGNLRAVQVLLGHKNITTTEIYTRVLSEDLERAMQVTFDGTKIFSVDE